MIRGLEYKMTHEEKLVWMKKYNAAHSEERKKYYRERWRNNTEYRNNHIEKHRVRYRTDDVYRDKCRTEYRKNKVLNPMSAEERLRRKIEARLRRHNNPEYYRAINRKSYRNTKDRVLARLERRKATGNLSVELIQQVYESNIKRFGTLTCYLCVKPVLFGDDNLEHKIPIVRGGKHTLDNMDIAHASCNRSKGSMTLAEYLKSRV